jgi:hypothetical protein
MDTTAAPIFASKMSWHNACDAASPPLAAAGCRPVDGGDDEL